MEETKRGYIVKEMIKRTRRMKENRGEGVRKMRIIKDDWYWTQREVKRESKGSKEKRVNECQTASSRSAGLICIV